mmetsp:Transcript_19449/g.45137  ORF Transcript_19449/g.45137 Transcript_19449/m.45137 type:complete len:105 (+) Transcript_19449:276-590(+)
MVRFVRSSVSRCQHLRNRPGGNDDLSRNGFDSTQVDWNSLIHSFIHSSRNGTGGSFRFGAYSIVSSFFLGLSLGSSQNKSNQHIKSCQVGRRFSDVLKRRNILP